MRVNVLPPPPRRRAVPAPVARRVRVGRRVLLTLGSADAEAAVARAAALRARRRAEEYAIGPATLEDAYLR